MTKQRTLRFVKVLLKGASATRGDSNMFLIQNGSKKLSLDSANVNELVCDGVLIVQKNECRASDLAQNWVKRQLSQTGTAAEQHRELASGGQGITINLLEGPLARLAIGRGGEPAFLLAFHLESAKRIQMLTHSAQMVQRTTMSYDPARVGGKSGRMPADNDLKESAIDAGRKLNQCLALLPKDCAGVVLDVCGFQKGLQLVELERRWPRRSAKLVLRIGLEQVAAHFGISPVATGKSVKQAKFWMEPGVRPDLV